METSTSTERLMADLQAVVRDTENLLKATAGDASERAAKARAHAEESLHKARARMSELEHDLAARAHQAKTHLCFLPRQSHLLRSSSPPEQRVEATGLQDRRFAEGDVHTVGKVACALGGAVRQVAR